MLRRHAVHSDPSLLPGALRILASPLPASLLLGRLIPGLCFTCAEQVHSGWRLLAAAWPLHQFQAPARHASRAADAAAWPEEACPSQCPGMQVVLQTLLPGMESISQPVPWPAMQIVLQTLLPGHEKAYLKPVPWHALQVMLQTLLYTQDQLELWAAQQLLHTFCSANQPGCTKLLGTVQPADTRPGPGGPAVRTFGSMLLTALLATGGHSLQVSSTGCEWVLRCLPLSTGTVQHVKSRPGPRGPAACTQGSMLLAASSGHWWPQVAGEQRCLFFSRQVVAVNRSHVKQLVACAACVCRRPVLTIGRAQGAYGSHNDAHPLSTA